MADVVTFLENRIYSMSIMLMMIIVSGYFWSGEHLWYGKCEDFKRNV